jgi:hypothetical protein
MSGFCVYQDLLAFAAAVHPTPLRRRECPERLQAPRFQGVCQLRSWFTFKTTAALAGVNPTSGLILLRTMASVPENATWRLALHCVQAATEYVLLVVWGPAALLGLFEALGGHGHKSLVWAMAETRNYLLCGALLYLAVLALQRIGSPLFLIRVFGGIAAPPLALLAGVHNFHYLWYREPYPLLFPLIFLAIVFFDALAFGTLFLPRLFKAGATPRLHIHWAVVALLVPFVPSSILHAVSPEVRIFTSGKPAVRLSGEVIFALWTPSAAPLTIDSFPAPLPPSGRFPFVPDTPSAPPQNLTAQEAQRLRSAGITGHIQVAGMSALTNTGRIVLIMSRQLDASFQCFAPVENTDVIYLQRSAGWQKLPPETAESNFLVRLYIPEGNPKVTGFEFDNGSGTPWRQEPRFSW